LKLPEGVTLSDDPHKTIASFHYKHAEAEPVAAAPAEGAAAVEPVVLKEKKPEEGAEAKPEKK
jgi:hypothetical protein